MKMFYILGDHSLIPLSTLCSCNIFKPKDVKGEYVAVRKTEGLKKFEIQHCKNSINKIKELVRDLASRDNSTRYLSLVFSSINLHIKS
jgi:hypothetical protein